MSKAIEQAKRAYRAGEFPVGCVIADGKAVLAEGFRVSTRGRHQNEIDHAEINALRNLTQTQAAFCLEDLTLYATMEPCLMCFAATLLTGIRRIVYAYEDAMGGGTACDLDRLPPLYRERRPTIVSHVLREKSLELFQRYFADPENAYWRGSPLAQYTLAQKRRDQP